MAFAIRMPALHRLSCFRDDLVFLVFIYQRYIYRIDPTRVNEFGWSPEAPTGETADAPHVPAGGASGPAAAAVAGACPQAVLDSKDQVQSPSASMDKSRKAALSDKTPGQTAGGIDDTEALLRRRRTQQS